MVESRRGKTGKAASRGCADTRRKAGSRSKDVPGAKHRPDNPADTAAPATPPVVGLVGSAGGLHAFKAFLDAMPSKNGMAFLIISHLDPRHESLMVQLLARHTDMPVSEAREGQSLQSEHVYIIPPDRYLTLGNSVIQLSYPPDRAGGETAHGAGGRNAQRGVDGVLVQQLEYELKTTREELQSTIEELGSSNEELKASNEEVMSMNEELQSANEELETSKEELQSLNEELGTVNVQLQDKVMELESTTADMANLMASTDMPILFLGTDCTIRRFTPSATRLFNLIDSDQGRPLGDITMRFEDPELSQDIDRVLRDFTPRTKEVRAGVEQWYLRHITPYRIADERKEGVVLTFADITSLKQAEVALREVAETLDQRVEERSAQLREERNFSNAVLDIVASLILAVDTVW